MPQDIDQQLEMTAQVVEVNLSHGDQVDRPRQIDHLAAFRSRASAAAAAAELQAAGYRIDGMRRRLLKVWLEFSGVTAVGHERAAEFTREVVGILDRHSGVYDGWSGFLVTGAPGGRPEA